MTALRAAFHDLPALLRTAFRRSGMFCDSGGRVKKKTASDTWSAAVLQFARPQAGRGFPGGCVRLAPQS